MRVESRGSPALRQLVYDGSGAELRDRLGFHSCDGFNLKFPLLHWLHYEFLYRHAESPELANLGLSSLFYPDSRPPHNILRIPTSKFLLGRLANRLEPAAPCSIHSARVICPTGFTRSNDTLVAAARRGEPSGRRLACRNEVVRDLNPHPFCTRRRKSAAPTRVSVALKLSAAAARTRWSAASAYS